MIRIADLFRKLWRSRKQEKAVTGTAVFIGKVKFRDMALRGTLTHWKTRTLANDLGISPAHALGLLEALWHTTAEDAPAGNIGRLPNRAIAMQMHTDFDPDRLIAAMIKSGHLDEHPTHRLIVHDWHQHADHNTKRKVERRGEKMCSSTGETSPTPRQSGGSDASSLTNDVLSHVMTRHDQPLVNDESIPEPEPVPGPVPVPEKRDTTSLFNLTAIWNENCGSLPQATKLTASRRNKLATRIGEAASEEAYIADFTRAVRLCAATPFLSGKNDRQWTASFDWLIENDVNMLRVLEGKYGSTAQHQTPRPTSSGASLGMNPSTQEFDEAAEVAHVRRRQAAGERVSAVMLEFADAWERRQKGRAV